VLLYRRDVVLSSQCWIALIPPVVLEFVTEFQQPTPLDTYRVAREHGLIGGHEYSFAKMWNASFPAQSSGPLELNTCWSIDAKYDWSVDLPERYRYLFEVGNAKILHCSKSGSIGGDGCEVVLFVVDGLYYLVYEDRIDWHSYENHSCTNFAISGRNVEELCMSAFDNNNYRPFIFQMLKSLRIWWAPILDIVERERVRGILERGIHPLTRRWKHGMSRFLPIKVENDRKFLLIDLYEKDTDLFNRIAKQLHLVRVNHILDARSRKHECSFDSLWSFLMPRNWKPSKQQIPSPSICVTMVGDQRICRAWSKSKSCARGSKCPNRHGKVK
jgi:hypothetical protein